MQETEEHRVNSRDENEGPKPFRVTFLSSHTLVLVHASGAATSISSLFLVPSLFSSFFSSAALFLISGLNALFSYVFNFAVWRGQDSDRGQIRDLSHEERVRDESRVRGKTKASSPAFVFGFEVQYLVRTI